MSLNIVELIENNPITKLSNTYQGNLLTKIKDQFTETDQQLFVSSFYCYLNYNQKNDFVIDLDNVWKWLGFSTKQKAKLLLEKQFINESDYKLLINQQVKQSDHIKGGHNKETIMLTIRTFKLFCLKAGTKKAEQIHEYYIKLEEILQEIVQEESNELKLQLEQKTNQLEQKTNQLEQKTNQLEQKTNQLEQKTNQLENQIIISEEEKLKIREKTLLEQFPPNTQCFYYGFIDNLSDKNERLIKFGNSNFLKNRVYTHKNTYLNFRLVNVFKVENKIQIENAMKEHPLFKERQRTLTFTSSSKKFIELLNINGLSMEELDKTIKNIITQLEYSPENYIKLLEENRNLKMKLEKANQINNTENLFILQTDNTRLKLENLKLIKRYTALTRKTNKYVNDDEIMVDTDLQSPPIAQTDINNYSSVINSLKKIMKNSSGTYDVGGKQYELLIGTRQEVWDGKAYKTAGGLLKHEFIMNKHGDIVSKRKSISETQLNRLFVSGVNKKTDSSNE
jgi:hypothetical protein